MSEDIRVNITRAGQGSPIATNITLQLDKISAMEASTFQGADPHFTYKAFTTLLPLGNPQLVLFRDRLIDQVITDVLTGNPRNYLIINDPEMHVMDGHWQWICTRVRGT